MAEVISRQTFANNPFCRLLGSNFMFLIFFIFTLGFESFSNLIVFVLLFFYIKHSIFQSKLLIFSALLFLFLLPFYFMYFNDIYLKYWTLVLRMLLIVNMFNFIFMFKLNNFDIKPILNTIYYIHVLCIVFCFISPQINAVITNIFAFSVRDGNFRVSGFFSGFDIVSFFILVYLAYDYLGNKNAFRISFLIKLLLGTFAIFVSGRFGVIPLSVFVGFLFLKVNNIKWAFLTVPILLGVYYSGVFESQLDNITSTIKMLQVAAVDLEQVDNSFFEGQEIEGQYNQSPLTWYFEFMRPFRDIGQYILPGNKNVVDSGPSFFVLNFGLFIALLLYVMYFYIIKNVIKVNVPWIVIFLILFTDLKFRLMYSQMPLIWLLLNHLQYASHKNKELSKLS
jgi:hypothetical protein